MLLQLLLLPLLRRRLPRGLQNQLAGCRILSSPLRPLYANRLQGLTRLHLDVRPGLRLPLPLHLHLFLMLNLFLVLHPRLLLHVPLLGPAPADLPLLLGLLTPRLLRRLSLHTISSKLVFLLLLQLLRR